jgi:putative tricarboxylic transport membrane protein
MYIGNVMLLVLNLPLIGLWVKILKVPYKVLSPLIIVFCLIGAYSINNNVSDIYLMVFFGVIGYLARKFEFEAAPFILAAVLGPMMEKAFRQSLMISHGDFGIFINRPVSMVFLLATIIFLLIPVFQIPGQIIEERGG